MTIHYVCRGNVFRSLIAETYTKSLKLTGVTVLSSGTIADAARSTNHVYLQNTHQLLKRHGISQYAKAQSQQFTTERAGMGDLTILMNLVVHTEAEQITNLPQNAVVWNITDIGEGDRVANTEDDRLRFEEIIYKEITAKVDAMLRSMMLTTN